MYKSIFASLTGLPSDLAVLECAVLAANEFSAHVDCVHVSLGNAEGVIASPFEAEFLVAHTVEQLHELDRRVAERSANAQAAFERLRSHHNVITAEKPDSKNAGATFFYREERGIDFERTIDESRLHDLTILARESANVIFEPARAGTVMLSAGRPILIPPRKPVKALATHVALAWKNSAEASRAVASAMPFLTRARTVTVLTANEGKDEEESAASARSLARELKWHGINAQIKVLPFSLSPVAEGLLNEAYRLDADLLVMGGYGHSRLRELVFGGATRDILADCEIPVLMAH